MLKRYQRAQKKWFEQNLLEFEIYYYDGTINERIVIYDMHNGMRFNWPYTQEGKSLYAIAKRMEPWEVFFKFRTKFKRSAQAIYCLKMNYFTAKDIGEL